MRKLSGKTINSLALCVALAAPLVYLFGTLFMTLAGSHGNQLIAQPVYTEGWVETNMMKEGNRYQFVVEQATAEPFVGKEPKRYYFDYQMNNWNCTSLLYVRDNDTQYRLLYVTTTEQYLTYASYNPQTEELTTHTNEPWVLTFDYDAEAYDFWVAWKGLGTLYTLEQIPTGTTETNPGAYSDYLFGQFFAYDNFLAESGREVLNGTPLYGFEPIGELIRYTDEHMLHLEKLDYGPLVIGYTYYCAHVIIVDLIFYISSFIPRLIKKTINKLEGGLD